MTTKDWILIIVLNIFISGSFYANQQSKNDNVICKEQHK